MTDSNDWAFPADLQPNAAELRYELSTRLNGVVRVRSEVPESAFTATALGTDRVGNGVAIQAAGRTVVVTTGYLITEAQNIWLTTHDGRTLPGHTLAYDQVTGIGVIVPLGQLNIPTIALGDSRNIDVGDSVVVIGHGGIDHAVNAQVVTKREFAGYWEYLLDQALFVSPPHPEWGGAALIDSVGSLVGLGSLLVQAQVSGDHFDANLFIPVEVLTPIIDELVTVGAASRPARPWLGLYTTETDGRVEIAGVTNAGPAAEAHLRRGDIITHVGEHPVQRLAQFYRSLWAQGTAGCMVTLRITRGKRSREVQLRSASRDHYLQRPVAH